MLCFVALYEQMSATILATQCESEEQIRCACAYYTEQGNSG